MGNEGRTKRVARRRPPSLFERAGKVLFNPRLRQRERLERMAIAVAILLALIYLAGRSLLWVVARYFTS